MRINRVPARRPHIHAMHSWQPPAALALAALLAGCSALLPRASSDTPSSFPSYAAAEAAAARIVPFTTSVDELKALGFDPDAGSNVTVIPYPDLLARLVPYSGVPMDNLDAGIRRCIDAKGACRAYVFHFAQENRRREGGFWADSLNVNRLTHVTGWSFEATVVVADGRVLFRNMGGQPRVDRVERERNPLGPFQPAGESAGAILTR